MKNSRQGLETAGENKAETQLAENRVNHNGDKNRFKIGVKMVYKTGKVKYWLRNQTS